MVHDSYLSFEAASFSILRPVLAVTSMDRLDGVLDGGNTQHPERQYGGTVGRERSRRTTVNVMSHTAAVRQSD